MTRRAAVPAALALLAAAGCGSGSGPDPKADRTPTPTPPARTAPPEAGEDAERRTIDRWARALARSDVERAATFFALPVVVSQSEALRLRTRAEVEFFNRTLPCGARLVSVRRRGRYVVGTFRLMDRPGSRCDGPGGTAQVAFAFRNGRFSEWRRVPETGPPPAEAEPA